jgi:DNA invertase Pin-like site-specific DNA recombinase
MPARTLTVTPASKNGTAARAIQAVLRARVSSKEQEEEGFNLSAQIRPLREYAALNGITIIHDFVDVESSKTGGRAGFSEMVVFLKKHPGCRQILVEKTDRLYRNLTDYATLDELGVTIHLVKENQIIGPDSRSSEQFVHGIKVLVARNYSQNLGEETIKGMTEKARAGIYPSCAPVPSPAHWTRHGGTASEVRSTAMEVHRNGRWSTRTAFRSEIITSVAFAFPSNLPFRATRGMNVFTTRSGRTQMQLETKFLRLRTPVEFG